MVIEQPTPELAPPTDAERLAALLRSGMLGARLIEAAAAASARASAERQIDPGRVSASTAA